MDEFKKLLQQNGDYLMMYSEESDADNESLAAYDLGKHTSDVSALKTCSTKLTVTNFTCKKRTGKDRLPTRKPDPNVYNRNALLARENRKKKKIYLEALENELQIARKANRALLKALKHQMEIRHCLEKETLYFKKLLAERSNILGLYKCSKSSDASETVTEGSFPILSNFETVNFLNSEERHEMTSSSNNSIFGGETSSIFTDSAPEDLEKQLESSLQTEPLNWDYCINTGIDFGNLLKQDQPIVENNSTLRDINNDHSYVTISKESEIPETTSQNGLNIRSICSHNGHGELLDILCPTCSINPVYRKPPLQLLDDKL